MPSDYVTQVFYDSLLSLRFHFLKFHCGQKFIEVCVIRIVKKKIERAALVGCCWMLVGGIFRVSKPVNLSLIACLYHLEYIGDGTITDN